MIRSAEPAVIGEIDKVLIKSGNGETEILSIPEVVKAYIGKDRPRLLENSAVSFSRSDKYCFFWNSNHQSNLCCTICATMEKSEIYKQC